MADLTVKIGTILQRNNKRLHEGPGHHVDRMIGCRVQVYHLFDDGSPAVRILWAPPFNGIDSPYIPDAVAGLWKEIVTDEYFSIVEP